MAVYIGGAYANAPKVRQLIMELTVKGVHTVAPWLHGAESGLPYHPPKPYVGPVANANLDAIADADACVFVGDDDPAETQSRGGMCWEAGYAQAAMVPIILYGEHNCFYFHGPDVWQVETFQQLLAVLTLIHDSEEILTPYVIT